MVSGHFHDLARRSRPAASRTGRARPERRVSARSPRRARGGGSGASFVPAARAGTRGTARRRRRSPRLSGRQRGRPASARRRSPEARSADLRAALRRSRPTRCPGESRRRRTATGDAIRLLDERNGDVLLQRHVSRRDEVGRAHAAASAVAEDECSSRICRGVHVGARKAVWRVDLDHWHPGDCGESDRPRRRSDSTAYPERVWACSSTPPTSLPSAPPIRRFAARICAASGPSSRRTSCG